MPANERRLFVAMPYGERKGLLDGEDAQSVVSIDFDAVWNGLIAPAIPEGFVAKRADELREPGLIDQLYNEWLLDADVVLADLTFGNPNVFYELGIRQALSQHGTVLIAQARTRLPFDVRNQFVLHYDYFKAPSIHDFQKALRQAIMNAATSQRRSPVHAYLPGLFVARFGPGEDPETVIAGLRGRLTELETERANAAADAERIQRRLDAATTPAQLVAIYHELLRLKVPPAGLLEASAVKLRKFGLLDHAVLVLNSARERWPRDAALLRELGFCYRKRGPEGMDRARQFFEQALAINEADPELHGMVGGMLKRVGNYDEAYEHYRRAADLLPGNLYALVNLGVIDAIRGHQDTAMNFYRDVIRLTDMPTGSGDYWASFCRGEAAVFLGEPRIADQAYIAALACAPPPPVEDVRSAAEQMQVFITRGFQPKLASEMFGRLNQYITAGPQLTPS